MNKNNIAFIDLGSECGGRDGPQRPSMLLEKLVRNITVFVNELRSAAVSGSSMLHNKLMGIM